MQSRRKFIAGAAAAATLTQLAGCVSGGVHEYDEAAARLRIPISDSADLSEFVRFATLAPNGHNAQPWRFLLSEHGVGILPDFSRRTPVVDPDDHHVFVSLGCAAENFLIAAAAKGRPGAMVFADDAEGQIDIDLTRGPTTAGDLYRAIPARQSTRSNYDGRAVSNENLKRLEQAATIAGVSIILITDTARRETVLDHLLRGNSHQMDDPAFTKELGEWIRFNATQALTTGDGLFSKCSGGPTLPTWIGKRFFSQFFKKDAENAKYTKQLRSSAGVAVFIGDKADKDHWTRVGRSFQRFALQATALGIRLALINQPVEVPSVRADFARWLGAGDMRPDLVVRFGTAPPLPMSMRRPIKSVMVSRT